MEDTCQLLRFFEIHRLLLRFLGELVIYFTTIDELVALVALNSLLSFFTLLLCQLWAETFQKVFVLFKALESLFFRDIFAIKISLDLNFLFNDSNFFIFAPSLGFCFFDGIPRLFFVLS